MLVYLDTVRAERVSALRANALAAFAERVRETEARFGVGDATIADLAQARAERDVADAEVVAARTELAMQRALFEDRVGAPPRGLQRVRRPTGLPATLDEARRSARQDRPRVRAGVHAVRIAEYALRAEEARFGPSVDLTGRVRRTTTDPASAFEQNDLSVGLRLTLPLYRGGGAPVRQAKRDVARVRADLARARIEAAQRATDAWYRLESARQRRVALESAVAASRTALDGVRRSADVGERTTRNVLDAQRHLLERQIQVISAERNLIVEAYRLLEATGGLTARRLGIEGLPDLEDEARKTRSRLVPRIFDALNKE